MSPATLTDIAGPSMAKAGGALAVAAAAVGLGWLAGGANVPVLILAAAGVVALSGAALTPSFVARATMVLVPFTGIIANYLSGVLAGNTNLTDAAIAAFVVSAFLHRPASPRSGRLPVAPLLLGAVLMMAAVISLLNIAEPSSGMFKVGRMALAGLALLGAQRSLTADDARRCLCLLVLATAAACVLAFAVTVARAAQASGGLRLWAGLVDPNHFAVLVAMVLVLAIVGTPIAGRTAWMALVMVLLEAQLATASRSGAIALAIGVLATAVGARLARNPALGRSLPSRMLALLLLLGVGFSGFTVLAPNMAGRVIERMEAGANPTTDDSGEFRLRLLYAGVELLQESPLAGTGPGTFRARAADKGILRHGLEAHNALLETTVELGVIAGSCLAALMIWGIVRGARAVRDLGASTGESQGRTALAAWAAMVAGIAGSFTLSNYLYQGSFLAICMIVIATSGGSRDDRAPWGVR